MPRFTKAAAVADIQQLAKAHQTVHQFDLNNGTSQLYPRGATESMKAMIDRAAAYGKVLALQSIAQDIKSGLLGITK